MHPGVPDVSPRGEHRKIEPELWEKSIWSWFTAPPREKTAASRSTTWKNATGGGDSTEQAITSTSVRTENSYTRPVERIGAHAKGFNAHSIGICYEGGLDCNGRPKDTRTEWQKHSMRVLVKVLLKDYPGSKVCGHRDLSPDLNGNGEIEPEEWIKACPCFEVKTFF